MVEDKPIRKKRVSKKITPKKTTIISQEAEEVLIKEIENSSKVREMNDLARRIFNGQSPDLTDQVRVERIITGLKNQGYTDMSKLNLPVENIERFI
jgi:hypothetical protein